MLKFTKIFKKAAQGIRDNNAEINEIINKFDEEFEKAKEAKDIIWEYEFKGVRWIISFAASQGQQASYGKNEIIIYVPNNGTKHNMHQSIIHEWTHHIQRKNPFTKSINITMGNLMDLSSSYFDNICEGFIEDYSRYLSLVNYIAPELKTLLNKCLEHAKNNDEKSLIQEAEKLGFMLHHNVQYETDAIVESIYYRSLNGIKKNKEKFVELKTVQNIATKLLSTIVKDYEYFTDSNKKKILRAIHKAIEDSGIKEYL
jgi:hypothetical protein